MRWWLYIHGEKVKKNKAILQIPEDIEAINMHGYQKTMRPRPGYALPFLFSLENKSETKWKSFFLSKMLTRYGIKYYREYETAGGGR